MKKNRDSISERPEKPEGDIMDAYRRFIPHEVLGLMGKEDIASLRLGDHTEMTMTIREGACVRPWELAKEKGFDLSEEGYRRYCQEGSK